MLTIPYPKMLSIQDALTAFSQDTYAETYTESRSLENDENENYVDENDSEAESEEDIAEESDNSGSDSESDSD